MFSIATSDKICEKMENQEELVSTEKLVDA